MSRSLNMLFGFALGACAIILPSSLVAGSRGAGLETGAVCAVLPAELVDSVDLLARLPTLTAAIEVAAHLDDQVFSPRVTSSESGAGWVVVATYRAVPREIDHVHHARQLEALVRRQGGEYLGTGCASISNPR